MVTIRNTVKVTVLWTSVVGIAVGIMKVLNYDYEREIEEEEKLDGWINKVLEANTDVAIQKSAEWDGIIR